MTVGMQRARTPAAKQHREAAILAAAADLARRDGVREVTLTGIAAAVGLHKSAMLRYFDTRELIFLRLAADGWRQCSDTAIRLLAPLDASSPPDAGPPDAGPPDAGPPDAGPPDAVAGALAAAFTEDPLFCDLLAHTALNLERNVPVAAVRDFKLATLAARGPVVAELRRLRGLDDEDSTNVLATAAALVGTMWQMANPGPQLAQLYRTDPQLGHAVIDLRPRVARILTALLVGLSR